MTLTRFREGCVTKMFYKIDPDDYRTIVKQNLVIPGLFGSGMFFSKRPPIHARPGPH